MNLKQAQSKINSRESTTKEILDYYLSNYKEYNDKYRLLVSINEHLQADVDYMDYEIKLGKLRSHLHGIPFIVSDLINTKNLPTTLGLKAFENEIALESEPFIKRLKSKGLIFFGKSNPSVQQYLKLSEDEILFYETINPYNSDNINSLALAIHFDLVPVGFDINLDGEALKTAASLNLVSIKLSKKLVPLKDNSFNLLSNGLVIVSHDVLDLAFLLNEIVSDKTKKALYGKNLHSYVSDTFNSISNFHVATTFEDLTELKMLGLDVRCIKPHFKAFKNERPIKNHPSFNELNEKSQFNLDDFLESRKLDILIMDEMIEEVKNLSNPILSILINRSGVKHTYYLIAKTYNEDKLITLAENLTEFRADEILNG